MPEAASMTEVSQPADAPDRGFEAGRSPRKAGQLPHVLFLIDRYVGRNGGAEMALHHIIRQLYPDRFRCTLGVFGVYPGVRLSDHFDCPAYDFPLRSTHDWNALRTAAQLSRIIRREHVDITHTFFETSDIWGGTVAKLSGCPFLISSRRDMGIQRGRKHDIGYRVLRPFTDLVLPVSGQVRDFCIERDGLDARKVVTLYNGVDLRRLDQEGASEELRARLGLRDASHLISTVGNLRPIKGTDVMIRAMAIVRRRFPRAVYVIAGLPHDHGYADQLKELCTEVSAAENVCFAGNQDHIGRFLKMTQVFCLPSRSEGFSNALIEAMACSLPCVATRVGGNGEALEEGVSGYLVESEDVEAMASRISDLLENPERARKMGAAARRAVEQRFTVEAMAGRLAELYEKLLQEKGR